MLENLIDRITCGDILRVLASIPDENIDMIFADPPFNIGIAYNGYKDKRDDYEEWCAEWIKECFRVLKPTGSMYLMTLSRHVPFKSAIMGQHGVFISQIIWKKPMAPGGYHRKFWASYQPILLYGKTEDYTFHHLAQTKDSVWRKWAERKGEYRGQLPDIWDDITSVYSGAIKHTEAILKEGTNEKSHICQMPEKLPERAILFSSNPGDIILDPFMGSGTTAIASLRHDRHFIGIDISPEYVALAQKRIDDYKKVLPYESKHLTLMETLDV